MEQWLCCVEPDVKKLLSREVRFSFYSRKGWISFNFLSGYSPSKRRSWDCKSKNRCRQITSIFAALHISCDILTLTLTHTTSRTRMSSPMNRRFRKFLFQFQKANVFVAIVNWMHLVPISFICAGNNRYREVLNYTRSSYLKQLEF